MSNAANEITRIFVFAVECHDQQLIDEEKRQQEKRGAVFGTAARRWCRVVMVYETTGEPVYFYGLPQQANTGFPDSESEQDNALYSIAQQAAFSLKNFCGQAAPVFAVRQDPVRLEQDAKIHDERLRAVMKLRDAVLSEAGVRQDA